MPKAKTFRSMEQVKRFYFPNAYKREHVVVDKKPPKVIVIIRRPGV